VAAQYGVDLVVRALGGPAISQVAGELKKVETAAKAAQGSIDGAANNIRGFGAAAQATGASVNGLGSKFASLAAQLGLTVSAIALVKSSLDAAFGRDVAETRLRNLTGSAQEYELALKMAAVASQRFGITQTEATKALGDVYGRLQGVGYGLKEINQIYTGFNVIAKQSGMAAEEASGAFFQLSQALGKGKLNGDEFVIIAERMPQLLDAIAQTTGASRGELTQMAQEGKITGDVLYKALAGSVAGANNLNGALTKQQTTMADVARYADEMRVQLGAALAPTFLAIMQQMGAAALLLSKGFQAVATWAKQNETAIVAIVNTLLKFGAGVAIVFTVVKAFQALQMAIAAAAAAKAFLIGLTGKGLILVAAAAAGAALAYKGLSDTIDGVGQEVGKLQKEASAEMAGMTAEIEKQQDAYSSLPKPIENAKEAAKELKKEQEAVTGAIEEAVKATEKQATAQAAAVEGQLQVTQARLQAEQAVNQVLLDQAQRQLQAATSQKDRVAAAQRIYDLTVRQAQLEFEATTAAIQAETQKAQIALKSAQMKEKEVKAVVQLAVAQGTVTKAHYEALAAQREAVGIAYTQVRVANRVAAEQTRAAEAVYQGKVNAAKAAYQQNIVAKNTQAAAEGAGQFANNMRRGANEAERAANAVLAVGMASTEGDSFGEAGKNAAFMAEWNASKERLNKDKIFSGSVGLGVQAYYDLLNKYLARAEEFNQKKAAERNAGAWDELQKYGGAGWATGVAKPQTAQVNINYQGSTVTMPDGSQYVNKKDTDMLIGKAVDQTISVLGRDPGARRRAGIS
jgi:tape measure domain-containing protein